MLLPFLQPFHFTHAASSRLARSHPPAAVLPLAGWPLAPSVHLLRSGCALAHVPVPGALQVSLCGGRYYRRIGFDFGSNQSHPFQGSQPPVADHLQTAQPSKITKISNPIERAIRPPASRLNQTVSREQEDEEIEV